MVARHETRADRQAFLSRLNNVQSDEDRVRLSREHKQFLNGERSTDADFATAPQTPRLARVLRPPPMGKDAAYMLANKRLASEMRKAIAAKTVAGSGKKAIEKKKEKEEDEAWAPGDDEADDDNDDSVFEEAGLNDEDSEAEDVGQKVSKTAAKTKAAAKNLTAKITSKKPRKRSSRTLAKDARIAEAAAKKCAAAKKRQDRASAAQRAGKDAKEAALLRLGAATNKKRNAGNEDISKRRTSLHEPLPLGGMDSSERSEVPSVDIPAALPPPDAVPPPVLDDETTATDDHGFDGSNIDGLDPNFNDLEALNSDCDDDEDEMTFDESVANNDPDAPDEIPVGANDATIEDPVGTTVLQDEPTSVADDGETEWPVLNQDEMVGFVKNEAALARMRRSGWYLAPDEFPPDQHYPGLYNGVTGPTDELKALADSPLDLFLYFMPRTLWETIAQQSTLYHEQHLVERVERMFEKQRVAGRKTREEFMEQEARHGDIKPDEIVVLLGLLIARMINPQRRHFYDHWSTTSVGAIPAGTFGKFMKRNRFTYILSNLHFTDNADERAGQDRAWKIRSVVDTLQLTFKAGFIAPAVIAFDEAMIPLQNQHNPTRQYVANKPHKWGTKLFMTCCAQTSYCLRIEVYCGKAQHRHEIGNVPESVQSVDHNTGPAAVMRNLDAVLPPPSDGVYHLIVTDRFYTSVQLAYQLLQRQVYCVGTTQGDKQGFCNAIGEKNRDRPRSIPHGTTRMAVAKNCPSMTSLVWWDRRPVQLLGTGGSRRMESCFRWRPGGVHAEVPCPSMMRDYHRWMGGVDVHDQLRLQRYSLQQQTKCKKYYKAVFLGLVDIAIVNAYVVFRDVQKQREAKPQTHAEFLMHLQAQMLEVTEEDFAQRQPQVDTTVAIRTLPDEHVPRQNPDFQIVNGQRKRRQRQCKVCSNRKRCVGERRATKIFCPGCSPSDKARTYLCNKVWPHYKKNTLTCHQIWHLQWNNGKDRPKPRCGRDTQNREAGTGGKRKRRRVDSGVEAEDTAADNEDTSDATEHGSNGRASVVETQCPTVEDVRVENDAGQ